MGHVLVEEYPYAHVVSGEHTVHVCANCMRKSKKALSRCSRCRFAHYCGSDCQKEGWLDHKEECSCLLRVHPRVPTAMARLMSRVIVKRTNDKSAHAFNGRTFDSLVSHNDDITKDAEKSEFFVSLSHVLCDYMGAQGLPSASELFNIFGKVMVNVFTISDDDLNTIGLGLYLGLSALDHSCDPDAFVIFDGKKAILRPLRQAVTAYSADLRISYCDLLDLRTDRQNQLQEQFFFKCGCVACMDAERDKLARSVRCDHCEDGCCPLDEGDNSLVCRQCGATSKVRVEDAVHLMQKLEWQSKRLQDDGCESLNEAKELYKSASGVLSSLNIPLCHLADRIVSCAIDNANFVLAADYIEATIACFEHFYPPSHPSLSLQYFKAGKLHALSDCTLDIAAKRLEQAVSCLHSSHGAQHKLTLEAYELLAKVQQQRRDLKNQRLQQLCD